MNGLSAAGDVEISDVTSDRVNADILRKLKSNDPDFTKLQVGGRNDARQGCRYAIEDARSMGVLGYYLGRCTNVTTLTLSLPAHVIEVCMSLPQNVTSDVIEPFFGRLGRNISIETLHIMDSHIPRDFFRMLTPFIRDNPNLETFHVEECRMNAEQYRALSLALREASKSLKHFFNIGDLGDGDGDGGGGGQYDHEESILANIEALKMHPQLEKLLFLGLTMQRNACTALSDLLRRSAGMQGLYLSDADIDDSGVEVLLGGLAHCRSLRYLDLCGNPSITVRGWRAVAALLEDPNSALRVLNLQGSGINDESATIFANAVAHNNTLTDLYLQSENTVVAEKGLAAFSKVLCNTTSVNSTFLSNHTLQNVLRPFMDEGGNELPYDLASLLALNEDDDKKRVVFRKILLHHDDFAMKPLFEWDLKALPFVIRWLERAVAYEIEREACTEKRKLSATYQFMRGMPELAVEGITRANKKSAQTAGEKRSYSAVCE